MKKIVLLIVINIVSLCCLSFNKTTNINLGDMVFFIDGIASSTMPSKDDGYLFDHADCTNGVSIIWNSSEWEAKINNLSQTRSKCTLYFKTVNARTISYHIYYEGYNDEYDPHIFIDDVIIAIDDEFSLSGHPTLAGYGNSSDPGYVSAVEAWKNNILNHFTVIDDYDSSSVVPYVNPEYYSPDGVTANDIVLANSQFPSVANLNGCYYKDKNYLLDNYDFSSDLSYPEDYYDYISDKVENTNDNIDIYIVSSMSISYDPGDW